MEGYVQFKFTNKSEVAVKVDFDTLGYENANHLPLIYYFNGRYYSDLYDTLNNRAYVYYFNEGDTVGITLDGGMDDLSCGRPTPMPSWRRRRNLAVWSGAPPLF